MSYDDSRQHTLPVNLFPVLCCPLVNLSGTKPVLLPTIQNLKRLWWCVKDDQTNNAQFPLICHFVYSFSDLIFYLFFLT